VFGYAQLTGDDLGIFKTTTAGQIVDSLKSLHLGGRIKRFFNLSLTDPKAWNPSLWNLFGSRSMSGEVVTEETALTYSAFWNAVGLISGTIGALPLNLMRQSGKTKLPAYKEKSYPVLHSRANPYMTAKALRSCLMAHILTWGNGYAEIVRNGYGEVVELWPIPPSRVTPEMSEGKLVYKISMPDGGEKYLPYEQVLHLHGLGFDGFQGYSIVAMARKSLGLGMAMETFGATYFGNGTHPGVIVSHPHKLGTEGHSNLKKSLTETYSGLGNSHRLMLLEDGMEIKNVSVSPEDSQFLESRQFQITDVARWFNLPVHKLKEMSKSSFNNIESEQISFVTDSILPWLVELEQSYNMQLLTETQLKAGFYYHHIVEGLLRANSKDRAEYYKALVGIGMMTPNEGRMKENMNPSDDPLMDQHWMPTGLIPVNMFEEYLSKNQGNTQPAQIEETTETKPTNLIELNPVSKGGQ